MERSSIPQLNTLYISNTVAANVTIPLGNEYSVDGKKYIFAKVKAGQYVRKGDGLWVNGEGEATIAANTKYMVNATADWDIEAITQAQYTLVLIKSRFALVSFVNPSFPTGANSCYEGVYVAPHSNGAFRMANAQFVLCKDTTITVSNANIAMIFTDATLSNIQTWGSPGDIVNTNVGISGVIAFSNTSNFILAGVSGTLASGTKTNVNIVVTVGGAKTNMACACANIIWRMTVGGTTGFPFATPINPNVNSQFISVNVSSAGTIQFCNTCVAGSLIKVGDIATIAGDTGYSSRSVLSVQNVYAYTLNAAPTADTVQVLGYGINVNSQFIVAAVNLL